MERYNALVSGYLRGLHGCFIVFDVTDRESFNKIETWIQLYKDFNKNQKRIMILLGNKVDLNNRVVSKDEAVDFAAKKGLHYLETSAKTLENVAEAFDAMVEQILNSRKEIAFKKKNNSTIKLSTFQKVKRTISKFCCE